MGHDVIALIILGICVVFFLTNWLPACVTGVMGCLLMVLCGVCSFEEAFSGFSSSITMLMASAMIVGIAMFRTGVAQVIGRAAVRWSHGSEKIFLLAMMVIGSLLSMFFANTAIIAVFIPIIESVCETPGSSMKRLHLVLPMAIAVMIGGAGTLVGCTPQLTANGMMKSMAGIEMTMWTLTAPMFGILIMYLVYMMAAGYRLGNRVFRDREEKEMEIDREKVDMVMNGVFNKKKMIIMTVILICMIASYVLNKIPVAYTAMICAILCIATGCCSVKDVVIELNWETVVFLASCLGLAEAVTVAGSGDLIGNAVAAMLGDVTSPFVIFAVVVLLTLVLSQFITNSTAIIIGLPIGLSLCDVYGMNPMPFCIGVTMAASLACCTPLAAAQITMTQVAGYKFSDYVRYAALPSVVMFTGILIFVPLFYPLAG